LRFRFVPPSESRSSRNPFRRLNAQKSAMQNTAGKKRRGQEDVDFDYLFCNAWSARTSARVAAQLAC